MIKKPSEIPSMRLVSIVMLFIFWCGIILFIKNGLSFGYATMIIAAFLMIIAAFIHLLALVFAVMAVITTEYRSVVSWLVLTINCLSSLYAFSRKYMG